MKPPPHCFATGTAEPAFFPPASLILLILAFSAAFAPLSTQAQPRIGEMKGFKFAEYFSERQTQMKSLLEGATGRRRDDGTILLTGAKLQTFKLNGDPEITVEAPQCVHDPKTRSVSSEGALSVRTADGKFALSGEGFRYGQTNQWLIISNNVRTTIHGDLVARTEETARAAPTGGATNEFEIVSHSFDYRSETGLGIYRENVRVTGTNVSLQSGLLTLELPMKERQLRKVSADEDVQMDYSGNQAWGQKVVYDLETGLARVTGQPRWQAEERQGRADEFLIDRTNKLVVATGHAWLSIPSHNLGATALLNPPRPGAAPPAASSNQVVEITSASYRVQTNLAVFNGPVALTNLADGQPRGSLTCRALTALFTGTNQISTLTAEQDVTIRQDENQITSAKAFFTGTNNLLELTGNPAWRSGVRTGKGDVMFIDGNRNEMIVRGNASMRLPAEELGSRGGPGQPDAPPTTTGTNSQAAEIFSHDYTMRAESASFQGGVYISHPRMAWACETMNIHLPTSASPERKIIAEQKVFFNLLDEKGQKVNGSAEKAVYTYAITPAWTNELMELTGNPVITTTNGTFRNRTIILDRTRNKVMAPGRYTVRGVVPGDTNKFVVPRKKWFK